MTKKNAPTDKQVTDAFEAGKKAALSGEPRATANTYTNWELFTAFNNGWKEGKEPSSKGPSFRTIRESNVGEWLGFAGDDLRAKFYYESDALEWRANDPLNKGTIGELVEREEQRKDS